ncbi:uncharacterized protein LOC142559271 [Dermacentor variabilis]|uniref:uncharacterized protein LOC142559271 n=1 Tax=Dermacentor variabilis TaxID=34621 RepID=UPI003F5B7F71
MPRVSKTGLGLTLLWATLYLLDGAQARSLQRLPGRTGQEDAKSQSAEGGDRKPKGNLLFQTEFWCIPFNLRWTCYTGVIECNCGGSKPNFVYLSTGDIWTWTKVYHERSNHTEPRIGDAFENRRQTYKTGNSCILTLAWNGAQWGHKTKRGYGEHSRSAISKHAWNRRHRAFQAWQSHKEHCFIAIRKHGFFVNN